MAEEQKRILKITIGATFALVLGLITANLVLVKEGWTRNSEWRF